MCMHGSHAYGTSRPDSDIDIRGIAIPPPEYFLGFLQNFEQAQWKDPDAVIFDIRKFMKLAMDNNPNALELLFVDESSYLIVHPLMREIIKNRDMFVSRNVKYRYSGYAMAQLQKLKRSQEREPDRTNPVRAELIEKFGYDTKDAMHVVRLLRMGLEIIRGEGVKVKRPDAEELLAIRDGKWKLSDLLAYSESMHADLDILYEKSPLPMSPDKVKIDKLCQDLVQQSFSCEVKMPVMQVGWSTMKFLYPAVIKANKLFTKETEESKA